MRRSLIAVAIAASPVAFVLACGAPGPAAPVAGVASSSAAATEPSAPSSAAASGSTSASAPPAVVSAPPITAPPPGAKLAATITAPGGDGAAGPAFTPDGANVVWLAAGRLHRFDGTLLGVIDARPVTRIPRMTGPLLVLHGGSDAAVDVASGARLALDPPKGYTCTDETFSADATRVSRNCSQKNGDDVVVVQDSKTGATVGTFKEFTTAAPVRAGSITDSGNFVFWVARASGAFEEIKSKVTGPLMSSRAVMAPDESVLFTVSDKNWMPDDKTPAQMLDPKTGRAKYTLPFDIERVWFSPDAKRFAASHVTDQRVTSITIHETDGGRVVATLPEKAADRVVFSPDAHRVVVRAGLTLKLYANVP